MLACTAAAPQQDSGTYGRFPHHPSPDCGASVVHQPCPVTLPAPIVAWPRRPPSMHPGNLAAHTDSATTRSRWRSARLPLSLPSTPRRRAVRAWSSSTPPRSSLDGVPTPPSDIDQPTGPLGSWYATVLFWKPQVAPLVDEHTYLPLLMPLAPASHAPLLQRFPDAIETLLAAHHTTHRRPSSGRPPQPHENPSSPDRNRHALGVMNELAHLATFHHTPGRSIWSRLPLTSPVPGSVRSTQPTSHPTALSPPSPAARSQTPDPSPLMCAVRLRDASRTGHPSIVGSASCRLARASADSGQGHRRIWAGRGDVQ
jgi:hypothetical protein